MVTTLVDYLAGEDEKSESRKVTYPMCQEKKIDKKSSHEKIISRVRNRIPRNEPWLWREQGKTIEGHRMLSAISG